MKAELFDELKAGIESGQPSELVDIAGRLECLRATVWTRLLQTTAEPPPEPPAQPVRCLTMPQAAEQYGINESTLRESGRRGELPVVHVGRSVYLRQETLERWIAARESGTRR